jgi:hypothetical protein
MSTEAKVYVLVHGAWHSNWCWIDVAKNLESQGHKVIAPVLPGHDCLQCEYSDITLKTYVDYIKNIIIDEGVSVVLVGHSMAGIIISQIAEHIPDKIFNLIYVAAFLPKNGESLMDQAKCGSTPGVSVVTTVNSENGVIKIEKCDETKELFFNCCDAKQSTAALLKLQEYEPFNPFIEKVEITDKKFGKVKKLYIECLQDNAVTIVDQRRMHAGIVNDVVTLDCDHSPFISNVLELTQILISCGRERL